MPVAGHHVVAIGVRSAGEPGVVGLGGGFGPADYDVSEKITAVFNRGRFS